jgi:nucleotide-binding universal stress UspA family protein
MIKRLVVGVDGSDSGHDAAVLGARLAGVTGAAVTLVGVHSTSLFPVPQMSDRKTLRQHAEAVLRREREQFVPDALIHTAVDYSVPRALRHYAQRWRADLVVVGSNPDATTGHVAIGRRSRQLLEGAPFAVAFAPRGLHRRGLALSTIGVGFDSGAEALAALRAAAELAKAADARLSVLAVVDDHVPALSRSWVALNRRRDLDELRQLALEDAQAAAASLGVPAVLDAVMGEPGERLRALSGEVDLIVVGSRRWGPVARLVSGGVGETLVADAACPVLIVPRPPGARRRHQATSTAAASSG